MGFTTADSFPLYAQALQERQQHYEWAISPPANLLRSVDPRNALAEARSIVVAVYDYFKQGYPTELAGRIGRLYLSHGGGTPMPIHRARFRMLREFVEEQGFLVARGGVGVPARQAGARAGVTNFGKNCFAFADGIGSFIVIDTLVMDGELEYGQPTFEVKCPAKCTLCIEECPTGALYEPLKMNPHRCVAYNSYATPGSRVAEGQMVLPADIRPGMGQWVYGCDVCQQVCPRNQPRLKAKLPANTYLEQIAGDLSSETLLNMAEEHFRHKVYPLLHYMKHRCYFQRNAAVALGNLGQEDALPALEVAMRDPDEIVRGHAAWALGRIGGVRGKRALETSLPTEDSEYARSEIQAALSEA